MLVQKEPVREENVERQIHDYHLPSQHAVKALFVSITPGPVRSSIWRAIHVVRLSLYNYNNKYNCDTNVMSNTISQLITYKHVILVLIYEYR